MSIGERLDVGFATFEICIMRLQTEQLKCS